MSEARHLDKTLRDDVRLLGEILGRVIARDRGAAFVDRIERIRALAKAARSGGGASATGEWDALSELLEAIPSARPTTPSPATHSSSTEAEQRAPGVRVKSRLVNLNRLRRGSSTPDGA